MRRQAQVAGMAGLLTCALFMAVGAYLGLARDEWALAAVFFSLSTALAVIPAVLGSLGARTAEPGINGSSLD